MRYVLYARKSRRMICESFDAPDDTQATTYAGEVVNSRMPIIDNEEVKVVLCDYNGTIVWRLGDQATKWRVYRAVRSGVSALDETQIAS